MNSIRKNPRSRNQSSGNVSLSHSEFHALKKGSIIEIRGVSITVEDWMIAKAQDAGEYVLVPYSKHSWLAKKT